MMQYVTVEYQDGSSIGVRAAELERYLSPGGSASASLTMPPVAVGLGNTIPQGVLDD